MSHRKKEECRRKARKRLMKKLGCYMTHMEEISKEETKLVVYVTKQRETKDYTSEI
jgi:hypothetical protein